MYALLFVVAILVPLLVSLLVLLLCFLSFLALFLFTFLLVAFLFFFLALFLARIILFNSSALVLATLVLVPLLLELCNLFLYLPLYPICIRLFAFQQC